MIKNKIILIVMLIAILLLVACGKNENFIGKTGIVIKEDLKVDLKDKDPESMDLSGVVSLNDLLLVLDQKDDYFKVIVPYGDIPRPIGYVPKDALSFDEKALKNGNQGELNNVNIYDSKDGKVIGTKDGVGYIEERSGEWALFELPGGEEPFWVKLSDISFDLSSQYPKKEQ
ncbi:hypothetical protein PV797_05940 [Clostridiaceae bacterium M8S5]|nr:hypothetical protein PV797_05940 [Clostridiaceae bacterium M8S5]